MIYREREGRDMNEDELNGLLQPIENEDELDKIFDEYDID